MLFVTGAVGVEFAMASVAAGLALHVEAIEELCEELARRGQFIADLGLAEWPDGTVSGRYGFRHALYREVLYRRIGSGRRVRLHRAVGVRLEAGYGAQASQLAAVSTTGRRCRGRSVWPCWPRQGGTLATSRKGWACWPRP